MKQWIGKEVLFEVSGDPQRDGLVFDGRVKELSPSGKFVRIGGTWYRTDRVSVLEEVSDGVKAESVAVCAPTVVEAPPPGPPAEAGNDQAA